AVSAVVGVVMAVRLQPVDAHLKNPPKGSPFRHLIKTATQWRYVQAFSATMLLATGGFMLMPFGSDFTVNNLGISLKQLPWVFMATGIVAMIAGPMVGKVADSLGKYRTFCLGSLVSGVMCA